MFARWWDNFQESCDVRLAVGCGCAVAWVLLVAVSPVVSTASTFLEGGLTWRSGLVYGALAAFIAMAALGGRLRTAIPLTGPAPTVPLLVGAAALSPVGAVLHQNASGDIAAACAGLLVGCGLAALVAGWAAPFSAVRLRKRVVGTVASAFAGAALYLLIALLPREIAFAFSLALAPASLFFAMLLGRFAASIDPETSPPTPQDESTRGTVVGIDSDKAAPAPNSEAAQHTATERPARPSSTRLLGPELSLATIVYGALFVLAGHVLPEIEGTWMASALPGLVNVGAFLVSEVAITLYMVKRIRRENPRVAYRPATILVATGFLLLPFVGAGGALLCMAIAFAGFGCFLVYLWIVLGNLCQRWGALPLPTVAFGFALVFAGIVVGETTAWALYRAPIALGYPAAVSIVSLFALVLLAWNMTDGSRYAQETVAMGGIPADHSGPSGLCDRGDADGSRNAGAGTGPDGIPTTADDAKLRAAAATYGLSPREVEVAALLLRGRSIPYICDELFIAKSTAQTHVRHIYAKMDITGGRQELIDRLESAECS